MYAVMGAQLIKILIANIVLSNKTELVCVCYNKLQSKTRANINSIFARNKQLLLIAFTSNLSNYVSYYIVLGISNFSYTLDLLHPRLIYIYIYI